MYGAGPTSAAQLDALVSEIADPLLGPAGFQSTKPRRWVRSRPPIRHLFTLVALKGATYVPTWGVSLDFVPHLSGKRLAWHRTDKTARLDLVYDPVDFDPRWRDQWGISCLGGSGETRRDVAQVLPKAISQALVWLDGVRDVATALERAEWLRSAERPGRRFGFDNFVQQPLAYAFLLARTGSKDRALEILAEWITSLGFHEVQDELRKLLTSGS